MKSMTGFGSGAVKHDNFTISVDLKTVNNRFLDINLRLSNELQQLESTIKRIISNRLTRGRVEVNLQYDRSSDIEFEVNRPLVSGYLAAMREMQDEFGLSGEPDLNVIARLPNVVSPKKDEPSAEFLSAIEDVFSLALDDLETMREKEGGLLRDELNTLLNAIESRIPLIETHSESVAEEYQTRLTKRISEMLAKSDSQIDIDQARLAQEVAYLADRAEIAEEIARLRTHIDHFREIMSDQKDVGKRLDFLTQELNREANTIASKTGNMTIKENSLAIKSEIEKIREQVQNIE